MSSPRDVFRHIREAVADHHIARAYVQTVTEELAYEYDRITVHWRGSYHSRDDLDLARYRAMELATLCRVAATLLVITTETEAVQRGWQPA